MAHTDGAHWYRRCPQCDQLLEKATPDAIWRCGCGWIGGPTPETDTKRTA